MASEDEAVSVTLSERAPKKNSVRFSTADDDAALHDVYVPKVTLAQIGRLEGGAIKVTIEPA